MNSRKDNEKLFESLDYITPEKISGAVRKLDEKKREVKIAHKRHFKAWKLAPVLAACIMLLCLAIPTTTIIVDNADLFAPVKGSNATEEINSAPEYDGSRGLLYEVNEDGETASFIGFGSCKDEDIVIASYYNGLPVVEMRNQPYYDENRHYNDFAYGSEYAKSITISDTVKRVLGAIIDQCPNLERVYIGASVESFNTPLMNYSSKVVSIEVSPENKNYSGEGNCLVDLRTKRLVWGCNTSVIPDNGSIEVIGPRAFHNAVGFSTESLPEGIKIIEPGAFANCSALVNIRMPSTLEKIWGDTFALCENLESVDLNEYSEIAPRMFIYCSSLKDVKGSENITYIDSSGFSGCTSLTVNLGPALEKIDEYAFAFLYKNGEAVINFAGTMDEWNAIEKAENWKSNSWYVDVNCTDGVIQLRGK